MHVDDNELFRSSRPDYIETIDSKLCVDVARMEIVPVFQTGLH